VCNNDWNVCTSHHIKQGCCNGCDKWLVEYKLLLCSDNKIAQFFIRARGQEKNTQQ